MPQTHEQLADDRATQTMLDRARRVLSGDVRPDDYLPVTPEVRAAADFELDHLRTHMKLDIVPEEAARQLRGWLLSFHHGGETIVLVEDNSGVVVLAAGEDEIAALFRTLPDDRLNGLRETRPEPF